MEASAGLAAELSPSGALPLVDKDHARPLGSGVKIVEPALTD